MADAKQGKTPIEDFYNGSPQSRVVLAKPRLGGISSSGFASSSSKGCNPFGSVLRPPQLKSGNNPFLKVTEATDDKDTEKKEKDEIESTEDRLKDEKEDEAPKFVPLGSSNVNARSANPVPVPAQPTTSTSSTGFVFGQNLSERVVIKENVNNGEATSTEHSSTNGTSELLFTSAVASAKENNQEEASSSGASNSEGLAAAAAEYERSHARPPPPTTNFTVTGEEGEINVLQISCRLFAWEAGSWRERGRGVVRLNEGGSGSGSSGGGGGGGGARLVLRVAGSLRVVLNTKLWPDMVVQRAGTKSLRITAADNQQQIKLYLIMGAPGDIVQLYRALTARIAVSKRTAAAAAPSATGVACAHNAPSQQAAERLETFYRDKPDDDIDNDKDDADADADADSALDDDLQDNERLDPAPAPAPDTHEYRSDVDGMKDDKQTKQLKRKEPEDDDTTTPKRQCPEILIE